MTRIRAKTSVIPGSGFSLILQMDDVLHGPKPTLWAMAPIADDATVEDIVEIFNFCFEILEMRTTMVATAKPGQ
jgi:hypothetical protein